MNGWCLTTTCVEQVGPSPLRGGRRSHVVSICSRSPDCPVSGHNLGLPPWTSPEPEDRSSMGQLATQQGFIQARD